MSKNPKVDAKDQQENVLGKQDRRGEVVAQAENLRYSIVPVQILRVNSKQVFAGEWPPRGMHNVQGLVNKLTELAETFVDRPYIRGLLTRPLERCA